MPLFKPRAPPQNDVDVILESIANGQFDDDTINELQRLADLSDDGEIDRIAETLLSYIMKTEDRNVLIGTVKALTLMPFLPEGKDEDVIRLMVTLFAVPQNMRITVQHKMLQNEILRFLLSMIKMDERYAKLMMTELIASLEYAYITDVAEAYPALEILARNNPEYFRPHTETLVKLLGSINKTTRAQSAKLIGIIGGKYPEYVSSAMPVLQSLASFYPDAQVKHNASEAYQILYHGLRLDVVETVSMKEDDKPRQRSMGFADILKKKAAELLSKPSHETPVERQRAARNAARERMSRDRTVNHHATGSGSVGSGRMTQPPSRQASDTPSDNVDLSDMEGFETEIKDILDRTRDEFTNDAEGILNSIGVGHLSIMNRDKLTITSDEQFSNDLTTSDGGMASHQHETGKQPIHARTSHLDTGTKHKPAAEQNMDHKPAGSKTDAEPGKHAHHEKKQHEESPEKRSKPTSLPGTHGPSEKAGFEKDLQGRLTAKSTEKPPRHVRSHHEKIKENKPVSRDAITLPVEDKPISQATSANVEKPVAKETKDQPKLEIIHDIKPISQEVTPARSADKLPRLIRSPHEKIAENKPVSRDAITLPAIQAISAIEEKPVAKEIKIDQPKLDIIQDIEPISQEVTPAIKIEDTIVPEPIKMEELPVTNIEIPITPVLIKTEESPIQEKMTTEPETQVIDIENTIIQELIKTEESPIPVIQSPIEIEETRTIESQKAPETIKTEYRAIHKETTLIKPADPEIKKDHKEVKIELPPAKRVEKAIAWAEKPAIPAPARPIGTPTEKGKTPMIPEEPAAKRVGKVLAWFEKVGLPEPEQPKIERQPHDIQSHTGRAPIRARPETTVYDPKPAPKTEARPHQANVESHHAHHNIKPPAMPENKKNETPVEKTVPPKIEHKMESSVLPPRSAVSRHETSWSSDPITPPVARKIGLSKIGMTEKPLEGKTEGKRETLVPGSSISGFGPNKRIYQCPKCGGRTLVEGELCKICKMTMEHPQEMVRCERCGMTNIRSIKFCRKCGANLEKDKT